MSTTHTTVTAAPTGSRAWTDTELLSRMLLRERLAWREFDQRFGRLILRCISKVTGRFRRCVQDEDVREIHAQLMLGLTQRDMHKLRSFEPERGHKLSSWIGMLATNCAWDYLRGISRQPRQAPLAEAEFMGSLDPDPCAQALERERMASVSEALSGFSEKDRVFVQLYYVDGLSPEEVAAEMDISVKTVYSKKHKITCRLQRVLEPAMAA
jgi:RNA polymerase sigma-70 factor (ECF subfamily)